MRRRLALVSGPLALVALLAACVGDAPATGTSSGSSGSGGPDGSSPVDPNNPDGSAVGTITSVTATNATIRRGTGAAITVTIVRSADVGNVTVTAEGLPQGVVGGALEVAAGTAEVQFQLQADAAAVFGPKEVTFRVSSTRPNVAPATTTATLLVRGAPGSPDTRYGNEGALGYSALAMPPGAGVSDALFAQGTLYLVAGTQGGVASITALKVDGTIDATRFGIAAGKVSLPLPPTAGLTGLRNAPRIGRNTQGDVIVTALYKPTLGEKSAFVQYGLPINAATGTFNPPMPSAFDPPAYAFTSSQVVGDGASSFFQVGITKSPPGAAALLPYLARRNHSDGLATAEKTFDVLTGQGETRPPEFGTEAFGASADTLFFAIGAGQVGGGFKPRIFIQPRSGGAHVTHRIEAVLTNEPAGTLAFSAAAPNGDVFFSTLKSTNPAVCYWRLDGANAPILQACAQGIYPRGVFPLPGGRVAHLVQNIGNKLTLHLRTNNGAEIVGWPATGIEILPSGAVNDNYAVVADDQEGLLLIELRSPTAGGTIRRFWD
jgi:hypothetical protein